MIFKDRIKDQKIKIKILKNISKSLKFDFTLFYEILPYFTKLGKIR
jgi:hypothetical protein